MTWSKLGVSRGSTGNLADARRRDVPVVQEASIHVVDVTFGGSRQRSAAERNIDRDEILAVAVAEGNFKFPERE